MTWQETFECVTWNRSLFDDSLKHWDDTVETALILAPHHHGRRRWSGHFEYFCGDWQSPRVQRTGCYSGEWFVQYYGRNFQICSRLWHAAAWWWPFPPQQTKSTLYASDTEVVSQILLVRQRHHIQCYERPGLLLYCLSIHANIAWICNTCLCFRSQLSRMAMMWTSAILIMPWDYQYLLFTAITTIPYEKACQLHSQLWIF